MVRRLDNRPQERTTEHTGLFRFAIRIIKYLVLSGVGCLLVSCLSATIGVFHLVELLLEPLLELFIRGFGIAFCLLAGAVVWESLQ